MVWGSMQREKPTDSSTDCKVIRTYLPCLPRLIKMQSPFIASLESEPANLRSQAFQTCSRTVLLAFLYLSWVILVFDHSGEVLWFTPVSPNIARYRQVSLACSQFPIAHVRLGFCRALCQLGVAMGDTQHNCSHVLHAFACDHAPKLFVISLYFRFPFNGYCKWD